MTEPSLFPADRPEQAGRLAPRLHALAEQGLYFGTSSWKYEGWLGSIYSADRYQTRGKLSAAKFERECLSEYAEVFPAVCGDFAFYQFPSKEYWRGLFEQVPKSFRFAFKVPEDITVARWPTHKRYGARAGNDNEHFLDAKAFTRFFARRLEPYRDQVASLIFEFGTFAKRDFPTPADFRARLGEFLEDLPSGFPYSVEIRNPEYLGPEYFELLHGHRVAHIFNAWTRMPELLDQVGLEGAITGDHVVVRALLARGRAYEQAVEAFQPYDQTQAVNQAARVGLATIAQEARRRKLPAFLFVNNRLEGNAPNTIEAVLGMLD